MRTRIRKRPIVFSLWALAALGLAFSAFTIAFPFEYLSPDLQILCCDSQIEIYQIPLGHELNYGWIWAEIDRSDPFFQFTLDKLIPSYEPRRKGYTVTLGGPSLLLFLIATPLLFRHVTTRKPHECQACGYNLTANTTGRCPECGAPVICLPKSA